MNRFLEDLFLLSVFLSGFTMAVAVPEDVVSSCIPNGGWCFMNWQCCIRLKCEWLHCVASREEEETSVE